MPGLRAENRKNVVSCSCKEHNKQHLAVPKVYYIIFQNKKDADAYASHKKYASTYARCKKHAEHMQTADVQATVIMIIM